jgi:hypothetical protein
MADQDAEQRPAFDERRLYRPTSVTALALDRVLIELEDGFGARRSVTVSTKWEETLQGHVGSAIEPWFGDGLCDTRVLVGLAVAMHLAIGHQFPDQLASDHGNHARKV